MLDFKEFKEAYMLLEQARIKLLFAMIPENDQDYLNEEQLEFINDMFQTEEKDGYVKITIKDILPVTSVLNKNDIKFHWLRLMHYALKDVKTQFKKVLCVVKIYSPAVFWDTDNRAIKIVLDSLRYNKIIPDDRYQYMSYMVTGEQEKEGSRTEIYLFEYDQKDIINGLIKDKI
ncbi:MAG: hypothetical protein PHN69_04675 [Candidatus Pacebacteria bacterium]|nr:hypothetical protein [Candidatus Paceibacterota bacterium]